MSWMVESSGLMVTSLQIVMSDQSKEVAQLKQMVLILGYAGATEKQLNMHRCARIAPCTMLHALCAFMHTMCTMCRSSTPLSSLHAPLRPLILHVLGVSPVVAEERV